MALDSPPRFVVFLPPAPSPLTLSSLKTAFGDTLSQVLKEVASHAADSSKAAILDIALACPHLIDSSKSPRSKLYDETQTLVAQIYKLICVIAAKDKINVEDVNGVDVRVLLIAWSPEHAQTEAGSSSIGPIVSLETLANSGRQWQYAFGVETDAGEAMVIAFVAAKGGNDQSIERVGSNDQAQADITTSSASEPSKSHPQHLPHDHQPHYHVAVGGTFDHLHIGHKLLLTMTLFAVDPPSAGTTTPTSATVGITGDALLVNKKHASVLESWSARQLAAQDFVDSILNFTPSAPSTTTRSDPGPNGKGVDLHYQNGLVVKCTEIQDPFGPTITEEEISAIIISAETRAGGKAVNDKREEKGWKALEVMEVDVLDAEEGGEVKEGFESKLSSTAIRAKLASKTSAPSL